MNDNYYSYGGIAVSGSPVYHPGDYGTVLQVTTGGFIVNYRDRSDGYMNLAATNRAGTYYNFIAGTGTIKNI